jgi:hemoglobin
MLREPHPKAPGLAAGITEVLIHELVHSFYGRVRGDEVLGPIFESRVEDWGAHLSTMCTFWSSVTLMTGGYKGQPMAVHARISGLGAAHFGRWLEIFRKTATEVCPPEAAALFIDRSEKIAQSLQLGIAAYRGESIVPMRA